MPLSKQKLGYFYCSPAQTIVKQLPREPAAGTVLRRAFRIASLDLVHAALTVGADRAG
jgi:hypothetical protein